MSDQPEVDVDVHVAAAPDAVWPLVADINTPAAFSREFQRAEWIDPGDPVVGSRFRGHNRRGENEWSTECTVVSFDAGRAFGWVVDDPERPVATWSFSLEPDGAGTRLRMHAKLGPGESGVSAAVRRDPEREELIVEGRMAEWRRNMTATVEGIKALAEG